MYPKILPEVRGGAQRAEGSVATFDPIKPSTSQNSLRTTPEPHSPLRSFVALPWVIGFCLFEAIFYLRKKCVQRLTNLWGHF